MVSPSYLSCWCLLASCKHICHLYISRAHSTHLSRYCTDVHFPHACCKHAIKLSLWKQNGQIRSALACACQLEVRLPAVRLHMSCYHILSLTAAAPTGLHGSAGAEAVQANVACIRHRHTQPSCITIHSILTVLACHSSSDVLFMQRAQLASVYLPKMYQFPPLQPAALLTPPPSASLPPSLPDIITSEPKPPPPTLPELAWATYTHPPTSVQEWHELALQLLFSMPSFSDIPLAAPARALPEQQPASNASHPAESILPGKEAIHQALAPDIYGSCWAWAEEIVQQVVGVGHNCVRVWQSLMSQG